jgi:hypothetical protein
MAEPVVAAGPTRWVCTHVIQGGEPARERTGPPSYRSFTMTLTLTRTITMINGKR